MIRCITRWKALQRSLGSEALAPGPCFRVTPRLPRSRYATIRRNEQSDAKAAYPERRRPHRIKSPGVNERRDAEAWIALIDHGLPPHLRPEKADGSSPTMTPAEIAEIVLSAQGATTDASPGHDVLYILGSVHGRWKVVIWLVKQLVEGFASGIRPHASFQLRTPWPHDLSLEDITSDHIELGTLSKPAPISNLSQARSPTLDELTGSERSRPLGRGKNLSHDALGQIWCSLGSMVLACVQRDVQPEILEIIALLHHQEVMPRSIYNQKPCVDSTAIQQPPTLHLLSSRILTSLSDAAWRAHEKLVVEEARSKGGAYTSLRPEIPGMAYRVRVGGLRPEVWLELILWSCLHGGWFFQGASILRALCRETGKHEWRPLSWRAAMPFDQGGTLDWDALDALLNTKTASTMDATKAAIPNVQRTVSSEVVNAYVDAVLSGLDSEGNSPSADSRFVLEMLKYFRQFLERSNLTLGGGSWDAVILRFVESQGTTAVQLADLRSLEQLSPHFGRDLDTDNIKELPSYVLDGSAAMLGLFHRSLSYHVKAGNIKMALRILRRLQDYTDLNKRRSLEDFFHTIRSGKDWSTVADNNLFSSNYKIDYPGFDKLLPTTILAPLLELVTEAKAYDLGRWLLSRDEVDGVLVPEYLYSDPIMLPAMVRFATDTNDQALLAKLIDLRAQQNKATGEGPTLTSNVLQSFLDAQIRLQRWSPARRILGYMRDTADMGWNVGHSALIARVMLSLQHKYRHSPQLSQSETTAPKKLLMDMMEGEYDCKFERSEETLQKIDTLLIVLSSIDEQWAECFRDTRRQRSHFYFRLNIKWFNWVLEGVAEMHGSGAARLLLEAFWPQAARIEEIQSRGLVAKGARLREVSSASSGISNRRNKQRTVVRIPGNPAEEVVLYGGVQPDLSTIRIILRRALEEVKQQKSTSMEDRDVAPNRNIVDHMPSGLGEWATKHLRGLGMVNDDVYAELSEALLEYGLHDLHDSLPQLFHEAKKDDGAGSTLDFQSPIDALNVDSAYDKPN